MRKSTVTCLFLVPILLSACTADSGGGAQSSRDREPGSGGAPKSGATSYDAGLLQYDAPPEVTCPPATVTVSTADELTDALQDATPGDVIVLTAGTYEGNFVGTGEATEAAPIYLCGPKDAVIDSGGPKEGYGLHLHDAAYWRLVGFTVSNAQKGIMFDTVQHSVLIGMTVHTTGDEAIHLRKYSSDNVVMGCEVYDTGHRREKFGEGIYVGTAVSNWENITGGEPDTSDNNVIYGNTVHSTTAENIDIKEGTTGGLVAANQLSGDGLTEEGADSWVDVKGRQWRILDNHGTTSPLDGYQTHEIEKGWGTDNLFAGNTATDIALDDPEGVAIAVRPALDNAVACSNTVDSGTLSNVECI